MDSKVGIEKYNVIARVYLSILKQSDILVAIEEKEKNELRLQFDVHADSEIQEMRMWIFLNIDHCLFMSQYPNSEI